MGIKLFIPKKVEEEVGHPSEWLDGELESDSIDLDEWGFWQGYYGEM